MEIVYKSITGEIFKSRQECLRNEQAYRLADLNPGRYDTVEEFIIQNYTDIRAIMDEFHEPDPVHAEGWSDLAPGTMIYVSDHPDAEFDSWRKREFVKFDPHAEERFITKDVKGNCYLTWLYAKKCL